MFDKFLKYAKRITPINDESSFTWHKTPRLLSRNNCKTLRQVLGSTLLERYKLIEFL